MEGGLGVEAGASLRGRWRGWRKPSASDLDPKVSVGRGRANFLEKLPAAKAKGPKAQGFGLGIRFSVIFCVLEKPSGTYFRKTLSPEPFNEWLKPRVLRFARQSLRNFIHSGPPRRVF